MAHISIHNVRNVKIEKYKLDSDTQVCRITFECLSPVSKQESYEEITLFSQNKETFDEIGE